MAASTLGLLTLDPLVSSMAPARAQQAWRLLASSLPLSSGYVHALASGADVRHAPALVNPCYLASALAASRSRRAISLLWEMTQIAPGDAYDGLVAIHHADTEPLLRRLEDWAFGWAGDDDDDPIGAAGSGSIIVLSEPRESCIFHRRSLRILTTAEARELANEYVTMTDRCRDEVRCSPAWDDPSLHIALQREAIPPDQRDMSLHALLQLGTPPDYDLAHHLMSHGETADIRCLAAGWSLSGSSPDVCSRARRKEAADVFG